MSYSDSGSDSIAARRAEVRSSEWVEYSELDSLYYTTLLTVFSTLSTLASQPLNVVMTRQQCGIGSSSAASQAKTSAASSMISDVRRTYASIGFRGLFRGFLPIAVLGIPSHVIYFIVQESSREWLQKGLRGHMATSNNSKETNKHNIYDDNSSSSGSSGSNNISSYQSSFVDMAQSSISSLLANGASLAPYVPAEVISTRLIIQTRNDIGMTAMYKQIVKEEGWRGLLRGFGSSMVVGVVFSAQWWATYSIARRELSRLSTFAANPLLLDSSTGFLASTAATVAAHPLDTVKTRIMMGAAGSAEGGMLQTGRRIVAKEGSAALWRGLRASVCASAFNGTAFALMYEAIKRAAIKE